MALGPASLAMGRVILRPARAKPATTHPISKSKYIM